MYRCTVIIIKENRFLCMVLDLYYSNRRRYLYRLDTLRVLNIDSKEIVPKIYVLWEEIEISRKGLSNTYCTIRYAVYVINKNIFALYIQVKK